MKVQHTHVTAKVAARNKMIEKRLKAKVKEAAAEIVEHMLNGIAERFYEEEVPLNTSTKAMLVQLIKEELDKYVEESANDDDLAANEAYSNIHGN